MALNCSVSTVNRANGERSGHVRVFELQNDDWVQIGVDIDGQNVSDWLGWSVGLSQDGSKLVVGAPHTDQNGTSSGSVQIYEFPNSDEVDAIAELGVGFSLWAHGSSLYYNVEGMNNHQLSIVNISGQVVYENASLSTSGSIDNINSFGTGVFIVTMKDPLIQNSSITKKVVIN